jgi:hypothetical protein
MALGTPALAALRAIQLLPFFFGVGTRPVVDCSGASQQIGAFGWLQAHWQTRWRAREELRPVTCGRLGEEETLQREWTPRHVARAAAVGELVLEQRL